MGGVHLRLDRHGLDQDLFRDSHAGYTGVRIAVLDGKGGGTFKGDAMVTTDDPGSAIETAPTDAQGKPGDDDFLKP